MMKLLKNRYDLINRLLAACIIAVCLAGAAQSSGVSDNDAVFSKVANADTENSTWTGVVKPKDIVILANAQSEANAWKDKI